VIANPVDDAFEGRLPIREPVRTAEGLCVLIEEAARLP